MDAQNCATASDQGHGHQRTDLELPVGSSPSMISCCGLPTRILPFTRGQTNRTRRRPRLGGLINEYRRSHTVRGVPGTNTFDTYVFR